jgi:hypothetical protein
MLAPLENISNVLSSHFRNNEPADDSTLELPVLSENEVYPLLSCATFPLKSYIEREDVVDVEKHCEAGDCSEKTIVDVGERDTLGDILAVSS